jgi:hypothetical protein
MNHQKQPFRPQRKSISAWTIPYNMDEDNQAEDFNLAISEETDNSADNLANSSFRPGPCRPNRPKPCPPKPCPPKPCPPPNDPCRSMGEMVRNPGMERFTLGVPTNWTTTTPNLVSQNTSSGRVHSGLSAVNLRNGANLCQEISNIQGGCFYEFSFFANVEGSNVALTATVTFVTPRGTETQGALISIEAQDIPNSSRSFGYYKVITGAAPQNATRAMICFMVASSGNQSVNIDDVSFVAS